MIFISTMSFLSLPLPKQLSEPNRLLTIYITVATKKGDTHTLAWVLLEQTDLVTKQAFGKLPVAMQVAMSALGSHLYIRK